MRTYDPADCISYVHLAQGSTTAPPRAQEECHRLSAGYANVSVRDRLGAPRPGARPALIVLPGGAATAGHSAPAATLRVAR